jgi:hypothetical protein
MIETTLSGCSKNACTCASTPPDDPAIGAMIVVLPATSAMCQMGGDAAGHRPGRDGHNGREAAEAYAELHDVVPDHRLHAAEGRVERHDDAEHQDGRRHRNRAAGRRADRQARHVDRGRHPAEAPDDEDAGGQAAHAHVEPRFEILVRREIVQPPIERQRDARDPRIQEQPRRRAKEQNQSVPDRGRGLHQVVDGAVERRHQRQADGQPRHRLAGEEEVVEVPLPPREEQADAAERGKIRHHDDDVDRVKRVRHLRQHSQSGADAEIGAHPETHIDLE